MNYLGKKILITGGLGFIGSNLAHRLSGMGADITMVDCKADGSGWNEHNIKGFDATLINKDMADIDKKILEEQDVIFNLAAQISHTQSMENPLKDFKSNVQSQAIFLDKCRNSRAKIIFTSTRSVYGKPEKLPVDENQPLNPPDVNGVNKMAGELYHKYYSKFYGIPVCILRLANVFGPRHQMKTSEQGVLNWFIRLAMDNKPIKLYDGEQKRDFIFVEDVVDALLIFAEKDGLYNIGSGMGLSLREAAETIVEKAGSGLIVKENMPENRKKIEIGDFVADISKAKKYWQPKTELEDGVEKTIDFYKKEKQFYW